MTIDAKYRIEDVGKGTVSQERRSRINNHGEMELGGRQTGIGILNGNDERRGVKRGNPGRNN